MWANQETADLVEWLRKHNDKLQPEKRVGFFGFDVYSLAESIDALLAYARLIGGEFKSKVEAGLAGIGRFRDDPISYASYTTHSEGYASDVEAVLNLLQTNSTDLTTAGSKAYFKALQNAFVIRNAEKHYRAMGNSDESSWNKRVDHMKSTIIRLLDHHGEDSRAILWAHNTHIGDARATGMARAGMRNIGWLTRARFGSEQVFSVGFATWRGKVLAGSQWGAPVEVMTMPAAISGSIEDYLHQTGISPLLLFPDAAELAKNLLRPIQHRAVGVAYNPLSESGNYVWSELPRRYNAMIFIDETSALKALSFDEPENTPKETAAKMSQNSELFKNADWHQNKWQNSPAIIEISERGLNLLFNRPEMVFGLKRGINFAWHEEYKYLDGKVLTSYSFQRLGEKQAVIRYESTLQDAPEHTASGSFIIESRP
jgi:erythromycin esterase-like protein